MTLMHAPPHPGEVIREYLGDTPITEAASKLKVARSTLSRIVTCRASVSPDMAIRLGMALNTSPELWAEMQLNYDLYQARLRPTPKVGRIVTPIKNMHRVPDDLAIWERIAPIGREFGSPDYERLAELDSLAFKALGSMIKARRWLDAPCADLGGLTPENAAKTPTGFKKVKRLLREKLSV